MSGRRRRRRREGTREGERERGRERALFLILMWKKMRGEEGRREEQVSEDPAGC